jgi:hypothetical protein
MAALEPQYMTILKKALAERFVPSLPPLLDTTKPAAEQQAKQLSRAFSAFVLHKLLDITPQAAAASVVDDFNDKGIDAIHYDATTETLYLLQTKLKESEQFKQEDALPFCEGIRLLLKQDFAAFNANVQARQADIESALDSCSHIVGCASQAMASQRRPAMLCSAARRRRLGRRAVGQASGVLHSDRDHPRPTGGASLCTGARRNRLAEARKGRTSTKHVLRRRALGRLGDAPSDTWQSPVRKEHPVLSVAASPMSTRPSRPPYTTLRATFSISTMASLPSVT